MTTTAVVRDPLYLKHSNGPNHPESPERLRAIDEMLAAFTAKHPVADIAPRDATHQELQTIHTPEYIDRIEATKERSFTMLDPDTGATADSYAAALRAAGGTMEAVAAVVAGRYNSAFALVRPPGHHAEASRAMGFCLFNNIAVGAMHAINEHGLKRILIVDWDLHHGNGTQHSFYQDNRVLYCSTHQYPYYPGTGRINEVGQGDGEGYTVNVPFRGGQGDVEYLAVFRQVIKPIALDFQPELVMVSAGFDTYYRDPLGGMNVTPAGYGEMMRVLMEIAAECCQGKVVLALEGGYNLQGLVEGIAEILLELLGLRPPLDPAAQPQPDAYTLNLIQEIVSAHKAYWRLA